MRGLTANSLRMMEKSMDFLWAKQAAHLDNIVNAETPNYKVKTVRFEELFDTKLRSAAALDGAAARRRVRQVIEEAGWTVDEDDEVTRMDENGVNVGEQLVEAVRTSYQIQYVMQSISKDISGLRTVING